MKGRTICPLFNLLLICRMFLMSDAVAYTRFDLRIIKAATDFLIVLKLHAVTLKIITYQQCQRHLKKNKKKKLKKANIIYIYIYSSFFYYNKKIRKYILFLIVELLFQ